MIRPARFSDIPQLLHLAQTTLGRSRYDAQVDAPVFKALALEWINQQQDKPGQGMAFVSDNGTSIDGVFAGVVRPLYECINVFTAANLLWCVADGAKGNTAVKLLKAFEAWANRADGKVLHRYAVSDAIMNPEQFVPLFERMGYRKSALIFEKEA